MSNQHPLAHELRAAFQSPDAPSNAPPATTPCQLKRPAALDRGALLTWIARHGVAGCGDLQLRFGAAPALLAPLLAEAVEAGLLRRHCARPCEEPLYVATARGLRAVGLSSLSVCPVQPRAEAHLRVVARTASALERLHASTCAVLSERELRASAHAGRWWSQIAPTVHHGGSVCKRPDLILRPHEASLGLPLAVEVELSVKSPARLYAICAAWGAAEVVGGVLYLAAPAPARALSRAIARAKASARITVLELPPADVPALRRRLCPAQLRARCASCALAADQRASGGVRSEKAARAKQMMEEHIEHEPGTGAFGGRTRRASAELQRDCAR
ncbi:MAG TPA: hypothetical protein VKU89_00265 [Solirubrobacteraceae bacterium]|nr:hypothetical protein [Solirubrobacteraceae bacterium]